MSPRAGENGGDSRRSAGRGQPDATPSGETPALADVTNVVAVTRELSNAQGVARGEVPKGVEIYEVNGPFFFGADKIKDVLYGVARKSKGFILRMRNVPAIEASCLRVLDDRYPSFRIRGSSS